jgi:hypothetical protein
LREQTIDEVSIYIKPPEFMLPEHQSELKKKLQPGQELPKFEILIKPNHLAVGIKGNPPFLNVITQFLIILNVLIKIIGRSWRENKKLG